MAKLLRLKRAARVLLGGDPGTPGTSWFQKAGRQIHARGLFVGCPLEVFEYSAKDLFTIALMYGLRRDSMVLEVGCGCLRTGYWFIDYLRPGHYCGIEPNRAMLDAGRELLLGARQAEKAPRFSFNDDFDFDVFGTKFDFVAAYSIWSHASKVQIETMLDSFVRVASPGARFVTSWLVPRIGVPDYDGEGWVGRSHQSDQPGLVGHTREWLTQAATTRGLEIEFSDAFTTLGQHWTIISRA